MDAMEDYGNEDVTPVTVMAKGVRRDVTAQYQAGVRYDDMMDLEIDGDPKARGKRFRGTKRVPPGMVLMFDQGRALFKRSIYAQGETPPAWGNGKELIDDSGLIFAVECSDLMGVSNRKLTAYFANQTES